jgi:hypothetical protein
MECKKWGLRVLLIGATVQQWTDFPEKTFTAVSPVAAKQRSRAAA